MAMDTKKIAFITGTRADLGKIQSLMSAVDNDSHFDMHIFVTGMHMQAKYGSTVNEIIGKDFPNIYKYINNSGHDSLDKVLANTISGFGDFVRNIHPDMIVVHGDRAESLAGALVGSLNNIIVAHIEGGEVSGTIDEHMRHAISKLAHIHFVSNRDAQKRLIQMGERESSIFIIGSPELDVMTSENLPGFSDAQRVYEIPFVDYGILLYHPVTTEQDILLQATEILTDALLQTNFNFIVLYPNNDPGTDVILSVYKKKLSTKKNFLIYPSIRFEFFVTLMKYARFLIGNSSAGIREAPYFGVPSINVGSRQQNRLKSGVTESIIHCGYEREALVAAMMPFMLTGKRFSSVLNFGGGRSSSEFLAVLNTPLVWKTPVQKIFSDLYEYTAAV